MNRRDTSLLPAYALITRTAIAKIVELGADVYARQRSEWGGLLWGVLTRDPLGRIVPVVLQATEGVCQATATSCEILPGSWPVGRAELASQGLDGLVSLGDWHTHPHMRVFMSDDDVASFWACGHIPFWLSFIVDPWNEDYGLFAKHGPDSIQRMHGVVISDRVARSFDPRLGRNQRTTSPGAISERSSNDFFTRI